MKYIKTYESFETFKFEEREKYWIIEGDLERVVSVLKVLKKSLNKKKYKKDLELLIRDLKKMVREICGIYLAFQKLNLKYAFYYWDIDNDTKLDDAYGAKNAYKGRFEGKMDLVDGKIVIDTFDADVEKYNL